MQSLWKQPWKLFIKKTIEVPSDVGYISEGNEVSIKKRYYLHRSFIKSSQDVHLSKEKLAKKICYVYAMKYYSSIIKDGILTLAGKQMESKDGRNHT